MLARGTEKLFNMVGAAFSGNRTPLYLWARKTKKILAHAPCWPKTFKKQLPSAASWRLLRCRTLICLYAKETRNAWPKRATLLVARELGKRTLMYCSARISAVRDFVKENISTSGSQVCSWLNEECQ